MPSAMLRPASLTVEAWVRLDFTASGRMVIFQQGAAGSGYALQVASDGNLQFVLDGTLVEAPSNLRLGAWTQVAGTYDGTTMRLYVDGIDVADKAFAGPIAYDSNGATIGAADITGTALWQGELDEIRVWNVARSASAIKANMSLALGAQAGLVAVWHLDESSGLTLADSSGNGLNATLGPVPGTATQLLSFALTAGQTYYLNVVSSTGDLTARFYNPNGYLLFTQSLQDRGAITPEVTGTYTLAVEGGIGNASPAAYSIQLVPTTVATAALSIGNTVSGSIALASQSVAYSFTLSAETRLLFDTLSTAQGLQWSLSGPQGPVVTNQALATSDGTNSPALPLLDLVAGAYTLTISGPGALTGAYSFRLLNAAAATAFTLGDSVTATLDVPTGTVLRSFSATAGDTVSFNVTSVSGTVVWELLDPYGRPVFGPSYVNDQTGIVLGATGTYLLAIEGTLAATSVASVTFASSLDSHTAPTPLTGTALTIGTAVTGNFTAVNGEDDYVFTAAAGARLYFDSLSEDNVSVYYTLIGPRGTEVPSTPFYSSDGNENTNPAVIALPLAGTYQIKVTNGGYTGAYSFNLLDLSKPTAVLPVDGSVLQTSLNPSNSTQIYTFNGTAGTNVFVAATVSYNYYQNIDLRLFDPSGREIQDVGRLAGNLILTIPVTGTYTLLVEGERDNPYYSGSLPYSLALSNIVNPAPVAITLGQDVSGQIAAGSVTNTYTLALATNAKLVLSSFTSDPTAQLAIIGATGTIEVFNLSQAVGYGSGSPVFSLAAGNYKLAVSSTSPTTAPAYGFSLYDMATAVALTADTPVSGTLQPIQAMAAYTIAATAGTQLRIITTRDSPSYYAQILVLDANGKPLAPAQSYQNNAAIFQIATTGTYTILFEGEAYGSAASAAYTLTAYVDPVPTPLALNTLVAGTLADQNAIARYSFTLAADTSLVFNSLTPNGNETWTLTGPNGYSLSRNFYYSGSYDSAAPTRSWRWTPARTR